jgi:two-component sensor histidine kinase
MAPSPDTGRVAIGSSTSTGAAGPIFQMAWDEQGGPPVEEPRTGGFGRTVIERMTGTALRGKSSLRFEKAGLTWRLVCPLDRIAERL